MKTKLYYILTYFCCNKSSSEFL